MRRDLTRNTAKWAMLSGALGLAISLAFLLFGRALIWRLGYPPSRVILPLWPSWMWLGATDGIEGTPTAYLIVSLSVLANVLLYMAVGSAACGVKHLVTRIGRR